jgi:hypothetical protein
MASDTPGCSSTMSFALFRRLVLHLIKAYIVWLVGHRCYMNMNMEHWWTDADRGDGITWRIETKNQLDAQSLLKTLIVVLH